MRTFALYFARWQVSTVVMAAPITVFGDVLGLPSALALALAQCVGAVVFYPVDTRILTGGDDE